MKSHRIPHVVFMALVAVSVAAPAGALPPPPGSDAPVIDGEPVGESELAAISGRYLGANMLVGLRVDLVSNLATAQGGSGSATGSLFVQRTADGFEVQVHSQAQASGTGGPGTATGGVATGGEQLQVAGIGQVTQIAGDGNRMANIAVIRIGDGVAGADGFNGLTSAQAGAGDLTARVTFADGGVNIGLAAGGAAISQAVSPANGGQVTQLGQIAGNGFVASNTMNLQLMTATMSPASVQQVAIQQALSAVSGLRR